MSNTVKKCEKTGLIRRRFAYISHCTVATYTSTWPCSGADFKIWHFTPVLVSILTDLGVIWCNFHATQPSTINSLASRSDSPRRNAVETGAKTAQLFFDPDFTNWHGVLTADGLEPTARSGRLEGAQWFWVRGIFLAKGVLDWRHSQSRAALAAPQTKNWRVDNGNIEATKQTKD